MGDWRSPVDSAIDERRLVWEVRGGKSQSRIRKPIQSSIANPIANREMSIFNRQSPIRESSVCSLQSSISLDQYPVGDPKMADDLEKLRYPVGRLPRHPAPVDKKELAEHLAIVEALPARLRSLVSGLTGAELETP